MPTSVPVPTKNTGDVFSSTMWNSYLRDNINKLLDRGHRVLTVAQFTALTGLEGTKGTVAPDEVYVEVDATAGVQWHLAYESGEATYKWRYIGGPALFSIVATVETTTSDTPVALTTAGPSIALPRAGDYDVETGFEGGNTTASGGALMTYDIGGTGGVNADDVEAGFVAGASLSVWRKNRKTGLTSVTLTSKYRRTNATGTASLGNRTMAVTPVRIRHDA